jgi:hypothetical protein
MLPGVRKSTALFEVSNIARFSFEQLFGSIKLKIRMEPWQEYTDR